MFRPPGGGRRVIQEIVAKFKERGATSPEKALTAQELGLGPRFEEAMKRRLGASGIFVEVGGKYYLDEAKLQQVQQQRAAGRGGGTGGWGFGGRMFAIRMIRMVIGLSVVVLALSNILVVRSGYVSLAVVGLLILWIVLTVAQMVYISRARRRWGAAGMAAGTPVNMAVGADKAGPYP